jgi:hypothetical protein
VEPLPLLEGGGIAGKGGDRLAPAFAIAGDQQPAVAGRRIRRDPPRSKPYAQIGRQRAWQQADQVGIARQVCADPGEWRHRDRGAAHFVVTLEDQRRAAGPGEDRRGEEPIVAATDDDDVSLRHRMSI